jgi:hypothetical protein
VGSPDNTAQIHHIDYSNNLITMKAPMTWTLGDKVWLYKDSNGRQVLHGSASDMGAYEFVSLPIDADADGIVDIWEIQYFGSISDPRALPDLDVDGDGLDNLAEQAAETSPIDRSSALKIISQSLSEILGFTITWQSVSNKTYVVESSTTLTNWSPAASVYSTANSTVWTEAVPLEVKKFYRVKVPSEGFRSP